MAVLTYDAADGRGIAVVKAGKHLQWVCGYLDKDGKFWKWPPHGGAQSLPFPT
jgi:hypothetical protein